MRGTVTCSWSLWAGEIRGDGAVKGTGAVGGDFAEGPYYIGEKLGPLRECSYMALEDFSCLRGAFAVPCMLRIVWFCNEPGICDVQMFKFLNVTLRQRANQKVYVMLTYYDVPKARNDEYKGDGNASRLSDSLGRKRESGYETARAWMINDGL
jgi:hypothetical protein